MKGIVFREFLEMVECDFGLVQLDELLAGTDLESGGVYTNTGTYPFSEMRALVGNLSNKTGIPVAELLEAYGKHLFGIFLKKYPHFFSRSTCAFDFLSGIENYIHVEVRKLYHDASLPYFEIKERTENVLIMKYSSKRAMGCFALGLIQETMAYYGEKAAVNMEYLNSDETEVLFLIIKI